MNTKLKKNSEPTMIVGGEIKTYILEDVALIFNDTNDNLVVETLKYIDVIEDIDGGPKPNFSIMGVDILRKFNKFLYDYKKSEIVFKR